MALRPPTTNFIIRLCKPSKRTRLRSGQFAPGQSGNPEGRPKDEHRVAELARSCTLEAVDTLVELMRDGKDERMRGTAAQALRSCKWSYIRLAALNLRWQNLRSYWAIAVVLTFLGRTISLLKPAENIAIFPFYTPSAVQMVNPQNNHKYNEIFNCLKSIHLSS